MMFILQAMGIWVLALILLFLITSISTISSRKLMVLALLLNAAVFFILVSHPKVYEWAQKQPIPHKLIFAGLLFCAVMGHYLGRSALTFPFVRWGMYGDVVKTPIVAFYEYVGVTGAGERISIKPAVLFRPLINGRIHQKLFKMLENPNREKIRLDETLRAIGVMHSKVYPDKPLASVEVYASRINCGDIEERKVERKLLWKSQI
jgi:hypothetical protein